MTLKISPIIPPTTCPECNSTLEIFTDEGSKITTRWCENEECLGRVRDLFSFIGSRDILEIDGLADDMAGKLVEGNYAINVAELFEFQTEALNEIKLHGEDKFSRAMAKKGFSVNLLKMVKSMEKAKTADWDRWIACLGIPMVSRTLGKVLTKVFSLGPDSMEALPEFLKSVAVTEIEGIGFHKRESIVSWAQDARNIAICHRLAAAGVKPKGVELAQVSGQQPLKGVNFVITGEFGETRESLTSKLEALGAVSKSGVSKHVNLLLVGDSPGKTKLNKAKDLGIKQVGKDWLVETLQAAGLSVETAVGFDYEEV